MKPGIELRGHIVVDGTPPSSWPQITLTPTDGLNYMDSAMVDEDGRFAVTDLEPAPDRVTIGQVPPPMFPKSARLNGRDLGGEIDLASASTASLEIVISHGTSSISGGTRNDLAFHVANHHRSVPATTAQNPFLLNRLDRRGVDGSQICVDEARLWVRSIAQRLAKQPFGGISISEGRQQEIDRSAC